MLNIKKIQYNGYRSTDFDVICDLAFDSDDGETSPYLNREAIVSEVYNGKSNIIHGATYKETFSPKVTLIKEDFEDFTQKEQEKIFAWLTSKSKASFVDFYDDIDSETIKFSVLAIPTEINAYKLTNGRTIGYTVTFQGANPWALSSLQVIEKTITNPEIITINCPTDDYESWVYPKITIQENGSTIITDEELKLESLYNNNGVIYDGALYKYQLLYYWLDAENTFQFSSSKPNTNWETTSVIINNITTNTVLKICNNLIDENIVIDGANKVLSTSCPNRIFGQNFNWKWIGLQKGENKIKVIGNCTIKFEYRYPMKLGEW